MIALGFAFFVTALLYAVAGFGGGSTYTALLVLADTDYRAVPILSLACNIIVVSAGTWRFARAGHFDWRRAWPLFVTSIPAAWIGGRLLVDREVFVALLAGSPPPFLAATSNCRESFAKTLPRALSAAPFLCLMVAHLE